MLLLSGIVALVSALLGVHELSIQGNVGSISPSPCLDSAYCDAALALDAACWRQCM